MRRLSVLLVVLMLFGSLVLAGCSGAQPKDLLVKFYEAIKKGDYQSAYDMLTPFYQENNDFEAFKATIAEVEAEKGPIRTVEVGKQDMSSSLQCKVDVTITRTKDGTDEKFSFQVAFQNTKGKWKIDGASALR